MFVWLTVANWLIQKMLVSALSLMRVYCLHCYDRPTICSFWEFTVGTDCADVGWAWNQCLASLGWGLHALYINYVLLRACESVIVYFESAGVVGSASCEW